MSRVIKSSYRLDDLEPYRPSPACPDELSPGQSPAGREPADDDGQRSAEEERLDELVASAQEKAAKILARAEEEARVVREEARRAGLAEGRNLGEAEARREARAAAEPAIAVLGRVADEVAASRAEAALALGAELLKLAVQIAERIIRAQARIDRQMAARAVAEALRTMVGHSRLMVRLNPVDLDAVYRLETNFRQHVGPSVSLDIVSDESVEPGGCLVETSAGAVDARLSTQLDEIGAAVREVTADAQRTGVDGAALGNDASDDA